MNPSGLRPDFSAARRKDGQLRRKVVDNHVRLCEQCRIYAAAVEDPVSVLAHLTTVELPSRLQLCEVSFEEMLIWPRCRD